MGRLSEPREWVHWWHLRNSGSKWGQLRKRVPFTLYHVLTCPKLWSCPCPSGNGSSTNTCGVTCVRRELQGALLGGTVQGIHSSAVVVSYGCWGRLSPTLSSNNTDLSSHSSGGQEFKIGFMRLPGCRGVESGAAPAQSPPCGPGPHTLADPSVPGRCLSVCAAPWYGRRNPAEGLAPSLCDGCTSVGCWHLLSARSFDSVPGWPRDVSRGN